jgi:hypothetical protein
MTDTLTGAEARAQEARTTRQACEAAAVEAVREQIGRHTYEEARRQLPILEQGLAETRAWLGQLARIERTSGASLELFRDILASMTQLCDAGTQEIRRGLAGFEQLAFGHIASALHPHQVDETQRVVLIERIRQDLRSFDGRVSFLKSQQARVDQAIRESGWPKFSEVPATPTVTVTEPAGRKRVDIPVEIGGGPRPPL